MKKKKKITRRSAEKYPALRPELNLKSRYDEIADIDYIDQLNDTEKAWLNAFNEEYINAKFDHGGKKIHKTKKQRKICYDKNNARNRDIYTLKKASGMMESINKPVENRGSEGSEGRIGNDRSVDALTLQRYEDYLIAEIDRNRKKGKKD